MKSFCALSLLCWIGVGFAAESADAPPVAPATQASVVAPQNPVTPAPGPVLTPGPVVTPADPWAEAMSAFATADSADAHAGGVVFVGSSSIRLWADLEKRYSSYSAVNRGFGGSTLADCVKHMDRLVLPHKPRLVVIYAGDNDLAGGRSSDQVLLDFVELTSRIQERLPKTQIVFVSIKPSPARIDLLGRIRDTNTKIRNYVSTKPYLKYIDVFTPMLDAQGKPRGELFGGDSLHLNAEGYALWHALISPVLPTEEQPAMVKGAEPPLMSKDAGVQKVEATSGAEKVAAAAKAAPKSAEAAKPDPQKTPPSSAAVAKSLSPSSPAVGDTLDAKQPPAEGAVATTPAGSSDAAATAHLPTTPEPARTVRANVKPADPAPSVPAAPPFEQPSASAGEGAHAVPTEDPATATTDMSPAQASSSEIATLPQPSRAVKANVRPVAAPASSSETPAVDAAAEPRSTADGAAPPPVTP